VILLSIKIGNTYLFFAEIIGEVCNHDLVLRGDSIGWGSTLTALTRSTGSDGLAILVLDLVSSLWGIGDVLKRKDLARCNISGAFLALHSISRIRFREFH
jgi:hypothetical protein